MLAGMKGLSRTLGMPMLIFYGTGMILGAGIYSIIGKAAAQTGDTLWLGFVFAGVSALLTALSYAELSAMFPKAGAEFVYLRETFKKKKWIGSTVGMAMAFSGAATAATVAMAFSLYLNEFLESPQSLVALAVLVVFTGIAIIGIKASGWVTVISTLIEVAGLLMIIYLGVTSHAFGKTLSATPHLGTLSGSALIIFSFFGFENIANLAEEAKEPERHLPPAIIVSVLISTVLYIFVSLSALALMTPAALAESSAPLMAVAAVVSAKYAQVLGAIALFSTANTALISLIGASRILYGMGEAKVLPQMVARVSTKRKTPWVASLMVLFAAALFLPIGKLETVASISSLATIVAFLSVNVSMVTLRYTHSSQNRPFRVTLSIRKLPILPVLAGIISLVLLTQFESTVYAVGGSLLLISMVGFWWQDRRA
jgi:basic amino acid/polyamine antiporter, APA family